MSDHLTQYGLTDEAAHADLFDIGNYIAGLSSFITSSKTPMTISIQGSWGSGKTSMMQMVRARLGDDIHTIWFNTWQFAQFDLGDSLPFSMMSVLLKQLNASEDVLQRLKKGLFTVSRFASMMMADKIGGGPLADGVGNVFNGMKGGDLASEIMELKDKFQKAVSDYLSLQGKKRVVVFVDDLDRLEPRRAVELLEVLKLFLDCRQCVFVLAIDYEVVLRGVADKYNFGDSEEERDKGKSFFDKIVQVPFKMPIASYNITNYVRKCFEEIGIGVQENELSTYEELVRTSIGTNPRTLKRLFNAFLLLTFINSQSEKQLLLFAVLCLQHFDEKIYNFVVRNRNKLSRDDFMLLIGGKYQELKESFEEELPFSATELEDCETFLTRFASVIDTNRQDGQFISQAEFSDFISVLELSTMTASTSENEKDSGTVSRARPLRYHYRNTTYGKGQLMVRAVLNDYLKEHEGTTAAMLRTLFPDTIADGPAFVTAEEIAASPALSKVFRTAPEDRLQAADTTLALRTVWHRDYARNFIDVCHDLGIEISSETVDPDKTGTVRLPVFTYAGTVYGENGARLGKQGKRAYFNTLLKTYMDGHPELTAEDLTEFLKPASALQGQDLFKAVPADTRLTRDSLPGYTVTVRWPLNDGNHIIPIRSTPKDNALIRFSELMQSAGYEISIAYIEIRPGGEENGPENADEEND